MTIQDKIKELITATQDNDDIGFRVVSQEQISGYLVFLQTEEVKAFADYKNAYFDRRIAESEFISKSDLSVSKAKETSPSECRHQRREETRLEIIYEGFKLFRQSIQTHLENMRQTTSHLKYQDKYKNDQQV
jgi:hypothetical protein